MEEIIDYTQEIKKEFKEITATVTMSKSICVEVPENISDEDLKKVGEIEIVTPDKLMVSLKNILRQLRIVVNLDLDGWEVDNIEIKS